MAEMEFKKLNEQHQNHENVDEPQQKHRNLDECENGADAVEPKTITNIYYDCLERIFDFLDIESLLMVANTCKRLQIAAAAKFGDEYGNKQVALYPHGGERASAHFWGAKKIAVFGLKFCLPFLRCFGGKITKLNASYGSQGSKDEYLDQYINQFCADTLTDISLWFKSEFWKEAFEKPFKSVEKVEVMECHLSGESLPNFANWFPNVRDLAIGSAIESTASINVHFPHLEHLELIILTNRADNERNESAMNMIQSNPQLQSLKIYSVFGMKLNTLLAKIHGNSTITKLKVKPEEAVEVNTIELERFVAEHPSVVELVFKGYRLTADDAINFIRQMKSLKRIRFHVSGRSECDCIIKEFESEWKSEVVTNDGKFYIKLNR